MVAGGDDDDDDDGGGGGIGVHMQPNLCILMYQEIFQITKYFRLTNI